MRRPTLIIVMGLPGSGKTTVAQQLEVARNAVRLSADEWMDTLDIDLWDTAGRQRVEQLQADHAGQLLGAGTSVVVEWGTWQRAERDALRAIAANVNAGVELYVCDAPIDELLDRITQRNRENPPITREQLSAWDAVIERPTPDELGSFDNHRPGDVGLVDHYGPDHAAEYDDVMGDDSAVADMVAVLAALAHAAPVDGQPRALEFGVGTGRVALALADAGVTVAGIDLSPAMLDQLHRKPGSDRIATTVGSFTTTNVGPPDGAPFGVVFLVFNTIMNVLSQAEQTACFVNAARHLVPGGSFVVEVVVPDLRVVPPGQNTRTFTVEDGYVGLDEYTDFAHQQLRSHHYWNDGETSGHYSSPFRYVWPSELDLMAQIAGLELAERWADWERMPFDGDSPFHVSIYRRPTRPIIR